MTVFFTATSALALIILAVAASRIDADSRLRTTDDALTARVQTIAGDVTYSNGNFDFGSTPVRDLVGEEGPVAFVDRAGVEVAAPGSQSLPPDPVIDALFRAASRTRTVELTEVPMPARGAGRWAATALPGVDSAIVLAGSTSDDHRAHERLDRILWTAVAALVIGLSLAGHLLSGRAMRPAARLLVEEEQFLVEAAHELRTPLTTMRLIVHEAERGDRDAGEVVRELEQRVESMNRIVSSLLVRARAQTGIAAIELDTLRLDQLVEVGVEDLVFADPDLAEFIQVRTEPAVVEANADLVVQALANCVTNAQRYGAPPIVISVTSDGVLSVQDAGDGIPSGRRHTVLGAGIGAGGGTGTGLAIVAWIAEVHHARLDLGDTVGGGLTVSIFFRRPARSV